MSTALPIPLTRFVGRTAELAQAVVLLDDARLLTLTGPGGSGKTRLALRLADAVAPRFPDGVWFSDLSALSDGRFVWDQVATALGVREPVSGQSWAETVTRNVASRQALLVLDNCEHLVEVAAGVAAALLDAAPDLKVVATSREPLDVAGEMTWAVPPLSDRDGFDLFSDRAYQARPELRLGDEDAGAVRAICRRLDGLPLAIELAAARSRAFAPTEIAAGLSHRLELLASGPRNAPVRHATLRASFDWSYELLSEPERALLRQLTVFEGGFHLEAALAVCPGATGDLVAALVDRSLVSVVETGTDFGPRYRMLETIREFASERLADAHEIEQVRTRHRDHFLGVAEASEAKLAGPDEDRWRTRLRADMDNLRAAMAWSRDQGSPEDLARIATALTGFWATPGRIDEFGSWLDVAMGRLPDLSAGTAARILNLEGLVTLISKRRLADVPALADEALRLARVADDRREMALALSLRGVVAGVAGGADAMRPFMDEALTLARESEFTVGVIWAEVAFLFFRLFGSDPEETRRLAEEAAYVSEAGADRHNRLFAKQALGLEALVHGRLTTAKRVYDGVVADGRDSGDSNYLQSLLGLAWIATIRGEADVARNHLAEATSVAPQRGTDSVSITSVAPVARLIEAWIELADGHASLAREEFGAVAAGARAIVANHASLPLVFLAEAQLALGELDEAEANLEEADALAAAGALTWILGRVARVRAELSFRRDDHDVAESLAHDAIRFGSDAGDQLGIVDSLELLARLMVADGRDRDGVRLWAAAESQRTELGYRLVVDRATRDVAVARMREALDPDDFATAWAQGATLSMAEAIAYAARGRGERRRPGRGWASLTPSELEVARLVGEHLSNPEIATRLFVSRATVKTHLVHIFAKLDIDSRSALAAQVAQHEARVQPTRGPR